MNQRWHHTPGPPRHVEINSTTLDPSPACTSLCFQKSLLRVLPRKVSEKRIAGWLGTPELEQSSRRTSTGPRSQQKLRQGLPNALKIFSRSLERRRNRMANRDLGNVVLSLASEGFRQTTLGSASPAARVPSACSRLPGLQLSCRKGNR